MSSRAWTLCILHIGINRGEYSNPFPQGISFSVYGVHGIGVPLRLPSTPSGGLVFYICWAVGPPVVFWGLRTCPAVAGFLVGQWYGVGCGRSAFLLLGWGPVGALGLWWCSLRVWVCGFGVVVRPCPAFLSPVPAFFFLGFPIPWSLGLFWPVPFLLFCGVWFQVLSVPRCALFAVGVHSFTGFGFWWCWCLPVLVGLWTPAVPQACPFPSPYL